ncbi:MAG TPA: type II secretion system F family protein [Vicinamibacterales bacterium]|nr:type II secretion system F family protein [Vicinamibacterales bacterium]
MTVGILVTLMFVTATAGIVGVWMLFAGRSQAKQTKTVEQRLVEVTKPADATGEAESLVLQEKTGRLQDLERVTSQALKGSTFERWVQQSGTTMSISACVLLSLVFGALGGTIAFMFSRLWWAGVLGFVAGCLIQPMLLRQKRAARLYKFEEHFPEALDLLSRAVRAGHAFSAGMKMVADEVQEPIGSEFRKAFDEQNYGLPLKESLNNLSKRIPLLDVQFFSTAVLIQRETGGNLSEILDNLANVVRERFKIRRQVRVHTAHGRFTGYVLMALPAFLGVALSFINPEHMALLFDERMGQLMIAATVVMQTVGFFWIKQIVKIEV